MTSRLSFSDKLRAFMERASAPSRRLSRGQVELSGMRVLQQLRNEPLWDSQPSLDAASALPHVASDLRRKPRASRVRWVQVTAAATIVIAAVATAILWRPAGDALFTVVEGAVLQGDPPSLLRSFGETGTIRSNGGGGAVLALTDESRIEMRSHSELSLERGRDGIRVRLNEGGIIVNAAKQRAGHLYVQTKDMTVSVDGTVFVVNADERGSRVAVVEGEVRVQQGATETKLRPGERVATSPGLEGFSVASELAWSRRAKTLVALLPAPAAEQQPATAAVQAPKEPRVAFEVISIRPSAPALAPAAGARGGGGGLNSRPAPSGCVFDSFGYSHQIDPRRFAVTRTTLLHLAAYTLPSPFPASGKQRLDDNCNSLTKIGLLSGGPDWIRTDVWDVVASIPEGTFSKSPVLSDPVLQQMIRTLLMERFGLVVRRETREIPAYVLKVGKDGPKFNGVKPMNASGRGPVFMVMGPDGKPVRATPDLPPPPDGAITVIGGFSLGARNVSMQDWADHLFGIDGRPVFDRTGLTGRYDFYYDDPTGRTRLAPGELPEPGALNRAVLRSIGLELEESKERFDVWVIERAEKPTEN